MKTTIGLLLLALVSVASAAESTYYPEAFMQVIAKGQVKDDALKTEIYNVLVSNHQRDTKGGRDTLGCDQAGAGNCYGHRVLGYDGARKVLFGKLHLEESNGKTFIRDVYCHKTFSSGAGVKPGAIPNSNQINCEHTWPQSKFTGSFPKDMQKSDLHHLFPTDSKANSVRGNYDFADISQDNGALAGDCEASKSGSSNDGGSDDLFEPPTEHKGNVARAIFYFSVRYKIKVPAAEERVLRKWNEIDPVDDAEMERNNQIQEAQGNRNPFIDFPNLANYINKF
ncbi:endonuclease I [Bacteriovorax stolpii]|nr:endonuclease [Bacteriovorax stolpii]TDP55399.1 endonuclease I [Bacteriovorax stolpii]